MTKRLTDKLRLAFAILFSAMPTLVTGTRGVARVNRNNSDAYRLRFVFHKRPELRERPVGMSVALRLPNSSPRLYAFEIFNGNISFRALSRPDESFADGVILVRLITALFAAYLSEFAMRRASAD